MPVTETDLRRARYEEAGHAIANIVAARHFVQDRLVSIRANLSENGSLVALVETDENTNIFATVMAQLQWGHLLSDIQTPSRNEFTDRCRARTVMAVAGKMAALKSEEQPFVPTLEDYSYKTGWWEQTQQAGRWMLRDRDKCLLLAFFAVETNHSSIALEVDGEQDRDVLLPVSEAYASAEGPRENIDTYLTAAESEAETILNEHWAVVEAIGEALRPAGYLTWENVIQVLEPFPDVMPASPS